MQRETITRFGMAHYIGSAGIANDTNRFFIARLPVAVDLKQKRPQSCLTGHWHHTHRRNHPGSLFAMHFPVRTASRCRFMVKNKALTGYPKYG